MAIFNKHKKNDDRESGELPFELNEYDFYIVNSIEYIRNQLESYLSDEVGLTDRINSITGCTKDADSKIDKLYKVFYDSLRLNNNLEASASEISDAMDKADVSVEKADSVAICLSEKIHNSRSELENMHNTFEMLEEKFDNISGLTNIINNISKTTSLLSKNASLEAAKAGETGNGFLHIANRINELSLYTKKILEEVETSFSELKEVIENVQQEIRDTSEHMADNINDVTGLVNNFKDIKNCSDDTKQIAGKISSDIGESAQRMNDMSKNLDNIETSVKNIQSETDDLNGKSSERSNNLSEMIDILQQFYNIVHPSPEA